MWIAGLVILAAGAFCGYLFHKARNRRHEMITTETFTAQELNDMHSAAAQAAGPGAFEKKCEVVGAAEPGPDGAVKSEISATECVWHRHVVKRKYWKTERRRNSNGSYSNRRVEKEETVAERESMQPFLVRDATGTVAIRPVKGTFEHMRQVVDRFEPHTEDGGETKLSIGGLNLSLPTGKREGTVGYKYEEWVLTPGSRVYVLGDASDKSGELAIDPPTLISTKDEEALLADARNKALLTAGGAVVAAVAGVVLIIVDIVS